MDKLKIERTVEDIALPVTEQLGYELVDVEFVKEEGEWYLRVYIDKENGVNLDDCANVSRILSDRLDEIDPIDYSYYLEVSSPGLDRPIKKEKDFERFSGRDIKIKLFSPLNGKKVYTGKLKGLEGDMVVFEKAGEEMRINKNLASSIRLNEY
ncbi:ribosome maturation factor RimP [Fonticella tunisiensis]|uniref:Ribosome maturation factor RimP n=1 Tax=Fonticella tunisiensis TaxID=1096341 RepID=A0A4R7KQS8_9CLOT|nr:ribosome maturation factor RimP [Fonticella tunisiensis]TDT61570.1 ribosome maturation factor RimP [Fonticella tunisiensis]